MTGFTPNWGLVGGPPLDPCLPVVFRGLTDPAVRETP